MEECRQNGSAREQWEKTVGRWWRQAESQENFLHRRHLSSPLYVSILQIKCYTCPSTEKNEFSSFLQCGHLGFFVCLLCFFVCLVGFSSVQYLTWRNKIWVWVAAPLLWVEDLRQVTEMVTHLAGIHQRSAVCKAVTRAFGAEVE